MIQILLSFQRGSFQQGFDATLQIPPHAQNSTIIEGQLPPEPNLPGLYKEWQDIFNNYGSGEEEIVREKARPLREHLNTWLNSDSFSPIKYKLEEILTSSEEVRLLFQADDSQLWRLPWEQWDLLANYPQLEIGLSSPASKSIKRCVLNKPKSKIRILLIEGNIQGNKKSLNTKDEIETLKSLFQNKADIELLQQPSPKDLSKYLRDENGWDIIYFAGHSSTDSQQKGRIELNENESLTIPELKYALRSAIALGLKLAIFNSCDGLGIARGLADLQIPSVVVMREKLMDEVAPKFVEKFFSRFINNESLYTSARQARESLKALENKYPCASWLPVICQNPGEEAITYERLLTGFNSETTWEGCSRTLLTLDAIKRLETNTLTEKKGLQIDDIYVSPNLGLVKRFKDKDPQQLTPQEKEQQKRENQFLDTYKQDEFFKQAIQRGRSPYSQGRRLAIIGEAGSGKSLLLQRIGEWIVWESDTTSQVVIWVSLADLNRGQLLEDYLQQNWLQRANQQVNIPTTNPENLKTLFASGQVFLLLDGADEMPIRFGNPLEEIVRQISQSEWVSQARIVLTCRVNVWEANQAILQNFDVYRNLDFSYVAKYGQTIDQVEAFISRWFIGNAQEKEKGYNLRQELEQEGRQQIKDLAKNPLRLSLLCLVWGESGSLPETKAELYQQFVEEIYKWKQKQLKINNSKIEDLNKKLAELAKRTLDQSRQNFVKWLMQFSQQSQLPVQLPMQEMLTNLPVAGMEPQESPFRIPHALAWSILHNDFDLALNLGWVNQVGVSPNNPEEAIYAFLHPSFHEYFAAQDIAFNEWNYFLKHNNFFTNHPVYGTYRVFEQQWREVILFWFGRTPKNPNVDNIDKEKESFLKALFKFQDRCQGFYALQAEFLAAAALAEFRNCSDEIAEKIIHEVVNSSFQYYIDDNDFSSPLKAERRRAYTALLQTNNSQVKDCLLELLNRIPPDHIGTRSDIADALLELDPGNQEAINTHLDLMRTDVKKIKSINIRYASRDKIRKNAHGNAAAIRELKRRLSKAKNEEDLQEIATTLAIIATDEVMVEKALKTLIELLYNCPIDNDVLVYPENFEEIAIGNFNLNIGEIVVERLTNLLPGIEYRHLPDEWKNKDNQIPWYENDSDADGYIQSYAFTRYQHIRLCAAISLFKIQPEHKAAVKTLVELAAINPNEHPLMQYNEADLIRKVAAKKIEKYGVNNQTLINTLSAGIATIDDEDALWWLADLLEKVAAGTNDEAAIIALTSKLQTTSKCNRKIAEALGKIKPANQDSIQALTKLINFPLHNSDEGFVLCEVIKTIGLLAPNHPKAIKSLIKLQHFAQARLINCFRDFDINPENAGDSLSQMLGEYCQRFGYQSVITEEIREAKKIHFLFVNCIKIFGEISREESEVINILTELLAHPEEEIRLEAALSLAKVDPGNSNALNALIAIHRTTEKHYLHEVDLGFQQLLPHQVLEISDAQRRQTLINAITEIMETHPNPHQRYYTAEALAEVDPGNEKVVATLLNLLENFSEVSKKDIINLLKETLRGNQLQQVVSNFKDALEEAYKDDNKGFQSYYELFWHCAENLSYPEFYRAFLHESDFYHLRPPMLADRALALTVAALANISCYISLCKESPDYLIFDIVLLVSKTLKRLFYLSAFSIFLIIWPPLFVIYSVVGGIYNRKLWSNLFYILKVVRVGVWGTLVSLFWFVCGLLYALWLLLKSFCNK